MGWIRAAGWISQIHRLSQQHSSGVSQGWQGRDSGAEPWGLADSGPLARTCNTL